MRIGFYILFYLLISTCSLCAQVNQTDRDGKKQGHWMANYPNGNKRYEGDFANGQPVGLMKRYHENGKLNAELFYTPQSKRVVASLYDDGGILYAKGIYTGTDKDSTWTYYNKNVVVGREDFRGGKREGASVTYYADDTVARNVTYRNDKLDGPWRDFFPSGEKKSEIMFKEGTRQGWSIVYYEGGQPQIEGKYLNDSPDGTWKFFAEDGKVQFELNYRNGELLNPELEDSIQLKTFTEFDRMRGKIEDPALFRDNPDELMRRSQP